MSALAQLPAIMVAPNGARRSKTDHRALPMTIAETVEAAKAAFALGAGALHAHVRDETGRHTLDAGLYRELIAEMARQVPDMPVQITTEAVGLYSPEQQRAVVEAVRPQAVSVALREMWPDDGSDAAAARFYNWAAGEAIALQHILYDATDALRLVHLARAGAVPQPTQLLFVLGRYNPPRNGTPGDVAPFVEAVSGLAEPADWAVCAFGPAETACLLAAFRAGGKARIGFENNLIGADGRPAVDNAQRVGELVAALQLPDDGAVF